MKNFHEFLEQKRLVEKRKLPYYLNWVRKFMSFSDASLESEIPDEEVTQFLEYLGRKYEGWQVHQAEEAIRLYRYYKINNSEPGRGNSTACASQWNMASMEMKNMLRLRQRSINTEKTYLYWLRYFYHFLGEKPPGELNGWDLRNFLSHLRTSSFW